MLHIKQRIILKKLAKVNGQRYSELFRGFRYEDKFPYHLKQLQAKEFITKRGGLYYISRKGLLENTKIDSETFDEMRYKIPQALFVCKYQDYYLVKEHFYKDKSREVMYGIPGISCKFEDNLLLDTCKKRLHRSFGVKGNVSFKCVQHYLEFTSEKDLLFDNIFLVFDVVVSEVLTQPEGLKWATIEDIKSYANLHSTIEDFILNKQMPYSERIIFKDYMLTKQDI